MNEIVIDNTHYQYELADDVKRACDTCDLREMCDMICDASPYCLCDMFEVEHNELYHFRIKKNKHKI